MKKVLIIDTLNTMFTLYHRKSNSVVWEFLSDIRNIVSQFKIDKIVLATEGGSSKYRLGLFPYYKGDRRKKRDAEPEAEKAKLKRFLEKDVNGFVNIMKMLGTDVVQVWGVEADDIIAYYANHLDLEKCRLLILSSDTDLHQLLRPGVVQSPYNKEMIVPLGMGLPISPDVWLNTDKFVNENGIEPWQYTYVKALAGDTSDSIPSPEGVGEGTALKLIKKYGTLDAVEEAAKNDPDFSVERLSKKAKASLQNDFQLARKAHQLVRLRDLDRATEEEVFGVEGLALVEGLVAKTLNVCGNEIDVAAFSELLLEYAQFDILDNLDEWLKPFGK